MSKPENVTCPDCGGPMVSRATKRNVHDMAPPQRFWGCAQFPKCRGTRDTDGEVSSSRRRDDAAQADDTLPSMRLRENDRRRWDR